MNLAPGFKSPDASKMEYNSYQKHLGSCGFVVTARHSTGWMVSLQKWNELDRIGKDEDIEIHGNANDLICFLGLQMVRLDFRRVMVYIFIHIVWVISKLDIL